MGLFSKKPDYDSEIVRLEKEKVQLEQERYQREKLEKTRGEVGRLKGEIRGMSPSGRFLSNVQNKVSKVGQNLYESAKSYSPPPMLKQGVTNVARNMNSQARQAYPGSNFLTGNVLNTPRKQKRDDLVRSVRKKGKKTIITYRPREVKEEERHGPMMFHI